jgi:uncharacterized protein with LGFP repeats
VRRTLAGLTAFLALTGTFVILPVYAAPAPEARPVEPSIEEVALGSVVAPEGDAVVTTDGEVSDPAPTAETASSSATAGSGTASPSTTEPTGTAGPGYTATSSATSSPSGPVATSSAAGPTDGDVSGTGDVATSGDELPGVPALTVSQHDTDKFSAVGVTWAQGDVTDVVVQLRVEDAGGQWGDWTTIEADDVAQTPSAATAGNEVNGGTAPYWTGESYGVEVIVQGAGGVVPRDVKVVLVDPGESPADALTEAPAATDEAHAASAMPPVYSRAQWGADESIRSWDPQYPSTLKAATIHHTADRNNYTADEVPAMMRSIYAYHTLTRGWGDIGYNVIVDRFGRMFEGRYGGLASTVIGAHAGGFNTFTFGVSMLGNYDTVPVPQATVDAVANFVAWKFGLYGIDPRGTTVLTSGGGGTAKYAAGVHVTLPTVFGHRDVGSTACPGQYGYARLGEIRNRVTGLVDANVGAIERRYLTEPALRASLGAAVGGEQYGDGYSWQDYANGRLYWSPTGGVHLMRGDILKAYLAAGGPAALGAPTTDEGVAGYWGAFNHFARDASIYWSADTGAQVVRGGIRGRWMAIGAEWSLGFPTGPEAYLGGGAVRVRFTQGDIYWSEGTGAYEVRGGIRQRWEAMGGISALGLPVSGESYLPAGGASSSFSSGLTLVWGPTTGAHALGSGILARWIALGAGASPIGFPTDDERWVAGGSVAWFQDGGIYWSASTGSQPVRGYIDQKYRALGGPTDVGFPLYPEQPARGGLYQQFSRNDAFYWSPGTGAHLVMGGIREYWRALGAEWGPLGLPTSDESGIGSGRKSDFQGGTVYWSEVGGTHAVLGVIGANYAAQGGPASTLGFPRTDQYSYGGNIRQDFTGGSLIWYSATSTVGRVP